MDAATVTSITTAIDFATIIVGIGGIFAALVLVKVAVVGGRKLMSVLR
jgi:hypothetical protein